MCESEGERRTEKTDVAYVPSTRPRARFSERVVDTLITRCRTGCPLAARVANRGTLLIRVRSLDDDRTIALHAQDSSRGYRREKANEREPDKESCSNLHGATLGSVAAQLQACRIEFWKWSSLRLGCWPRRLGMPHRPLMLEAACQVALAIECCGLTSLKIDAITHQAVNT